MFQDVIEQEAYQRARAAHLPHTEALEEARIAAAQTRAELGRAQAAQADAANPQPAFSWTGFEHKERLSSASRDHIEATRQQRMARIDQLRTEIAALEKDIAERPDPRVARRAGLVAELNRL